MEGWFGFEQPGASCVGWHEAPAGLEEPQHGMEAATQHTWPLEGVCATDCACQTATGVSSCRTCLGHPGHGGTQPEEGGSCRDPARHREAANWASRQASAGADFWWKMPFLCLLLKFEFGAGRGWLSVKDGSSSTATAGWVSGWWSAPSLAGVGRQRWLGVSPPAGVLRLGVWGCGCEPGYWFKQAVQGAVVG